jgi:predicted transcriptional regulator
MRFRVYLNGSNHWYLHSFGSCLDHKHHPKLDVAANTLSEKDLSDAELKLTNLLYNVNVPPSTIAKVLTTLRDDDVGIFLPKTLFNINEKCRSLIDVANGILPTCSDAEKTLILLQMYVDISILR